MNKTFTLSDLILFAYNETEMTDTALIVNELECNYPLKESFSELVDTMHFIESVLLHPADNSVDAILNYSRKLQLQ